jgi:P-type Ca2+ transporter type 2C
MSAPAGGVAVAEERLVMPLHTAVPGRARFKVTGLYGNDDLRRSLELALARRNGVTRASANVLTGNILVLFEKATPLESVQAWLEAAVLGNNAGRGGPKSRRARPEAAEQDGEVLYQLAERPQAFHLQEAGEVAAFLDAPLRGGLSAETAADRLHRHGPNRLPVAGRRSEIAIALEQFNSLPVALLGASAVLSLLTGGVLEAIAIAAVVGVNACIGYLTESEAERTIGTLSAGIPPVATVIRGGRRAEIFAEQLVPGDLLDLRPGSLIAADARLISADRLMIDESPLTGESMPVLKSTATLEDADAPLAERSNLVFMGTSVVNGRGRALVVATGRRTEFGLINALVDESRPPPTPLQAQLEGLGARLVLVSGAICGLVFLLGMLRGYGLLPMLRSSISLAIAAVPEGLPAIATTTLALGIGAMRRHKVLIRQLRAVEGLGSVQVVCFDKTGTITLNRMTVAGVSAGRHRLRIGDETDGRLQDDELARLMEIAVLCNEADLRGTKGSYDISGSPTEAALLRLALDCGLDVEEVRRRHPVTGVEHRAEDQQFMVTTHRCEDGGRLVAVKGSPSAVLGLCSWRMVGGERHPFSADDAAMVAAENESMAGEGLRVLGLAYANRGDGDGLGPKNGLCWLGLVGMTDPVRSGMGHLVESFHAAGIRTVMITGDQRATARAVAKQLGLNGTAPLSVIDAATLAGMSAHELGDVARKADVFARVSPRHKLEIVRAFQAAGQVTAMTGDGINDGPALRAADVGVAMGRDGTDLARQVASVVLETDDLETMLEAIRRGRTIHGNIRRSIRFILATNLSEIMVMLASIGLGVGQPLQPLQLLWINLVSDVFPCLALAIEPPEPDVLKQPPRDPREPIVGPRDLPQIAREAATISASALGGYGYGLLRYGPGTRASTLAFTTLISAQLLHAWTCRSQRHGIFTEEKLPANRYLDGAVFGSLALQVLAMLVPGLRGLLGIDRLSLIDGLVVALGGLAPFLINEAEKALAPRDPDPQPE